MARIKSIDESESLWLFQMVSCRVYDGDTLMDLVLDLGFGLTISTTGRLYGINAPEVRGKEKAKGIVSRDWLDKEISEATEIIISTIAPFDSTKKASRAREKQKQGKYGRWLIEVFADGVNLNELMVWEGLAEKANY